MDLSEISSYIRGLDLKPPHIGFTSFYQLHTVYFYFYFIKQLSVKHLYKRKNDFNKDISSAVQPACFC